MSKSTNLRYVLHSLISRNLLFLILAYIFLICNNQEIFSKNVTIGNITGKITDANSKESLPGVNIIIEGTVLGTTSDLQGNFELKNVPVGQYNIKFSMMGYQKITYKDVVVKSNETSQLTIKLSQTAIEAPELIVTASKRAQSIADSPTSISVLTSKDFEQKNQIYLDQLLEHVPGVNFMGNQINIRGSSGFSYGVGSRVMFLVDGVPVMSADTGEIKWDLIPTSQIERVEIVKSAGSALYGSSALGGVINVITKDAALKPETNIRFSAGYYDNPYWGEWKWTDRILHFDDLDIDHSRKLGKNKMFLSIGRHQSSGYRQNGFYQRLNGSGKFELKLNSQSALTFSSNWEVGKSGVGLMWRNQHQALEVIPPAIGDETHSDKFGLNAIHKWAVNTSFGLTSRASYFRNHWTNHMHDNHDHSTAQRFGLELQANYIFTNIHSLTFGTEEVLDHVVSGPLGKHDIYTLSLYLQDEIRVYPNVILTLGARLDHYRTDDIGLEETELSPKAGMVWHITESTTLRGSSGKGFRAPSISERFPDMFAAGLKVIPNLNLQPETAWSHEIGLNTPLSSFLSLDLAAFRNDYWDLIEPQPDSTNTVQFINVTRARISGLETVIRFSFFQRHLTGELGYTYLDPLDLDLKETLAYRSRHMFNGSITYRFHNLETGLDYKHFERLEVVKLYPNDPRVSQVVLDGRLSINYNRWTLSANVNNIFNHNHTQIERTIMPIRNYTAAIKVRL